MWMRKDGMVKGSCFLGIDVGTEGTKVSLFNTDGRVIKDSYEEYELKCPRVG